MLCRNCSESIFEYEGDAGSVPEKDIELETRDESVQKLDIWIWKLIGLSAILNISGFLVGGTVSNESFIADMGFSVFILTWIAIPLLIYFDSSKVEKKTDWKPYKKTMTILSAIWIINIFVAIGYIIKRHLVIDDL